MKQLNEQVKGVTSEIFAISKSPDAAAMWARGHEVQMLLERLPINYAELNLTRAARAGNETIFAARDPDEGSMFDPEGDLIDDMPAPGFWSGLLIGGIAFVTEALIVLASWHNFALAFTTFGGAFPTFSSIFTGAAWAAVGTGFSLIWSGVVAMVVAAGAAFLMYKFARWFFGGKRRKQSRKRS